MLRPGRSEVQNKRSGFPRWAKALVLILVVAAIAVVAWRIIVHLTTVPAASIASAQTTPRHTIEVAASDARGIIDALNVAVPGQTILVPPGEFLGPLILKDGVDIVANDPRQTVIRSDPSSPVEQGIAIVARGVSKAVVNGLRIASDDTHPLRTGVLLVGSSVNLVNLDISGAVFSGIRIEDHSTPRVTECYIHSNAGAGISIGDNSAPALVHNQVMQNGLMVNAVRPGIEIGPSAQPLWMAIW